MTREPSIHVSRSVLIRLIQEHFAIGGIQAELIPTRVDNLMQDARKYSIDHRKVFINTKKEEKVVKPRIGSSIGDANMLAETIYSVRIKLKHIGVTKIKQTDNQWAQVKTLVPTVNEFCERYNLPARKGYIEFVTTGLKLLNTTKKPNYNFCASWMAQKIDWILSKYEADKILQADEDSEGTEEICSIYTTEILDRTGITENYYKDSLQLVNFYKARELAEEIGVDYYTFIQAQFAALEFCKGIPRIEDLHGDKAKQRVIAYMAKNDISVSVHRAKVNTDWSKFRK